MSMTLTDCVLLLALLTLSSSSLSASAGGKWHEAASRPLVCREHPTSTGLPTRQIPLFPLPANQPIAEPVSHAMALHPT